MADPPNSNEDGASKGGPESSSTNVISAFKGIITVLVGGSKEAFIVHEDILCARSTFFKAACSKDWKENTNKEVHLPETDPFIFSAYLQRVYSSSISFAKVLQTEAETALEGLEAIGQKNEFCIRLCRTWILADYLGDLVFRNETMSAVVDWYTGGKLALCGLLGTAQYICASTSDDSALRKWLCDACLTTITPISEVYGDGLSEKFKNYGRQQSYHHSSNQVVLRHTFLMDASKYRD